MTYIIQVDIKVNKKIAVPKGSEVKLRNWRDQIAIIEFNGEGYSLHRDYLKSKE